jgi:hypothetical protein
MVRRGALQRQVDVAAQDLAHAALDLHVLAVAGGA